MEAIEEELEGHQWCFLAGSVLIQQIRYLQSISLRVQSPDGKAHADNFFETCLQEICVVSTLHEARNSRPVLCEDVVLKQC